MKYKLVGEMNELGLRRIKALRDFGNVKDGDIGGWVASEKNLSQEGYCWVFGDAQVRANAFVSGNARVHENALVSGNARVSGNAWVSGNARVYENALVYGDARVFGNTFVYENALVYGNARVSGDAWVFGTAQVHENALVSGNSRVYENAFVFGNARVSGDAWVFGNAQVYGDARVSVGGDNNMKHHLHRQQHSCNLSLCLGDYARAKCLFDAPDEIERLREAPESSRKINASHECRRCQMDAEIERLQKDAQHFRRMDNVVMLSVPDRIGFEQGLDNHPKLTINGTTVATFPVGSLCEVIDAFRNHFCGPVECISRRSAGEMQLVGWMTERAGDPTWPRLHKSERQADEWIAVVASPPLVTKRPVYAYLPNPSTT